VALPSDSTFAIAMKTQQAAEREEQQRIKNLVLNYDLRDGEDQDGESLAPSKLPNLNIHKLNAGLDKAAATNHSRPDKSGNNRSGQRARKLQLSDVDWLAKKNSLQSPDTPLSENKNHQTPVRSSKSSPRKPLGGEFLPNVAPPRAYSGPSYGTKPLSRTGRGNLSRKEILKEHASRNAALKVDVEK
jgi:regulator of nonsense transcripts 2